MDGLQPLFFVPSTSVNIPSFWSATRSIALTFTRINRWCSNDDLHHQLLLSLHSDCHFFFPPRQHFVMVFAFSIYFYIFSFTHLLFSNSASLYTDFRISFSLFVSPLLASRLGASQVGTKSGVNVTPHNWHNCSRTLSLIDVITCHHLITHTHTNTWFKFFVYILGFILFTVSFTLLGFLCFYFISFSLLSSTWAKVFLFIIISTFYSIVHLHTPPLIRLLYTHTNNCCMPLPLIIHTILSLVTDDGQWTLGRKENILMLQTWTWIISSKVISTSPWPPKEGKRKALFPLLQKW